MAGGTRWSRGTAVALGASLLLNAAFLASFLAARRPALLVPAELVERRAAAAGAPSVAGATLARGGTTQLADMYTAPLHLMKSLIDNALQGAGFGGKGKVGQAKKTALKRQKTQLSADPSKASMNHEVTEHKVVESTGAFFDPSIKAFVNPLLLPHLAEMNELQVKVGAHKLAALKSADRQIAQPTSGGKPAAPREPADHALFQWGTVNPVNNVMRLDCTDSGTARAMPALLPAALSAMRPIAVHVSLPPPPPWNCCSRPTPAHAHAQAHAHAHAHTRAHKNTQTNTHTHTFTRTYERTHTAHAIPTVMDASSNGAPMSRLWGSHLTHADMVDACGPGDECRDPCAYQMCNQVLLCTCACVRNVPRPRVFMHAVRVCVCIQIAGAAGYYYV